MPHHIAAALVSRWDSEHLSNTFTGGIHYNTAPTAVSFPYVIFRLPDESPNLWASDRELVGSLVFFELYYKENESTDPVSTGGTLLAKLLDSYDNANLTITGRTFTWMRRRGARPPNIWDTDRRVWQASAEYVIRSERPTSCPAR